MYTILNAQGIWANVMGAGYDAEVVRQLNAEGECLGIFCKPRSQLEAKLTELKQEKEAHGVKEVRPANSNPRKIPLTDAPIVTLIAPEAASLTGDDVAGPQGPL